MSNSSANIFESLSVPKALARFIVPAVISQLATLILNLTDAFFVGRTGDTFQISAMTITLPLITTMTAVATVFGAGGNANIAASLGAKKPERARNFSAFAIFSAIAVISVISLLIYAFRTPLLTILGADENSLEYCSGYVLWALHIACVPMVFSQVMAQMFSAEGDTKIASLGIAGAGILNVILDPIFIFVFKQGIVGAGIATCISNYCSAIFFLIRYFKKQELSVLSLNISHYTIKNGIGKNALSIGIPAGLGIILMLIVDFVRNYLFGENGTQSDIAAWGVVQKLGNAFLQIAIGISMGARPLISYNYTSSGLEKRTKSIIGGASIVMGGYTTICLGTVLLFPEVFVNLFLPIPDIKPTAINFLCAYIPAIFGIGFTELFNSVFQAIGHWKIAIAGVVTAKIILMIPAMFVFVHIWSITGIIIAQPAADTFTALLLLAAYIAIAKKHKERFK